MNGAQCASAKTSRREGAYPSAMFKFHSSISKSEFTARAIDAVVADMRNHLDAIDVAFVFFTEQHRQRIRELVPQLNAKVLIGCSAEGVIGPNLEIERQPGLAVMAGQMPGVTIDPIHISPDDWREIFRTPEEFRRRIAWTEKGCAVIGFGDAWTTPLNQFMQALDTLTPKCQLIGGMASAARAPGQNMLLHNHDAFVDGFVGVTLSGPIHVHSLVSQGARPIGQPLVITRGRDNVIEQLGGKPVMQVLRDLFASLSSRDQKLIQHGLLVGRAISEYREKFEHGDFLVRNVIGADQSSGTVTLTDHIRIGQTVQFHVRDADSAAADLRKMLGSAKEKGPYDAALLFSCNGRGTRMFNEPGHDVTVTHEHLPKVPVAGFFAAGEIGPVGGKNFIHGHTASMALIRQAVRPAE